MTPKEQRPTAPEPGLSKQKVVAEAIKIADREGVDGLSMRRLAGALGAGAMSLYHYVASKEDLLDAMIDVVFGEIEAPPEGTDWRSAMRHRSLSARQVLAHHPWAIALMDSRTTPGPTHLHHRESMAACLRTAGFTVLMTTHASWPLDSYVYGFALQEAAVPFADSDELTATIEDVYLPQLPPESFPYLNESATELAAMDYNPKDEFTFGLDLILGALESLRCDGPADRPEIHANNPSA